MDRLRETSVACGSAVCFPAVSVLSVACINRVGREAVFPAIRFQEIERVLVGWEPARVKDSVSTDNHLDTLCEFRLHLSERISARILGRSNGY